MVLTINNVAGRRRRSRTASGVWVEKGSLVGKMEVSMGGFIRVRRAQEKKWTVISAKEVAV